MSSTGQPGVLYLSYDGMLEPLGQGQVVAYLEQLSDEFRIHLISFEKAYDNAQSEKVAALRQRLAVAGITWHPQTYHKRPPILSTLWDMMRAAVTAVMLGRSERISLFHARSILSAAMLRPAVVLTRGRFLVDIRGFWADERVDGGIVTARGIVDRAIRLVERGALRAADHIVTLTHASVSILQHDDRFGHPSAPITVIPTCADLTAFQPAASASPHPFVLGYVGQIGGWYRFDRMVELFEDFRRMRPDATMLVINRAQQDEIHRTFAAAGVPRDRYEVRSADISEVPDQIRRMTVALSINAENFSNLARAPTKLAEYLGCGVPCLSSDGVGDVSDILERERIGVVIRDFSDSGRRAAVDRMFALLENPELRSRCVAAAHSRFALSSGVKAYRNIYHQLQLGT